MRITSMKIYLIIILWSLFGSTYIIAQDKENSDTYWSHLDLNEDSIPGISLNKAYNRLLKNKKPKNSVIVGVLDTKLDYSHQDLRDNIWINNKEIPENNIDDDKNGYIDDVSGWNFLGNKNN